MPRNDRLLKACRREEVDCTPVWLMRQAGRYMEEYQAIRKKHSFMEMCTTPELAAEVTLQPVKRFDVDGAIIFSDILLPLEKMGIPVTFNDGEGPVVRKPVRTKADVEGLRPMEPEEDMSYLMRAIEMTRAELNGLVPLIGFCGAPFTLASYLIEGGSSRNYVLTKSFMYTEPAVFHALMEKLTGAISGVLNAQIKHGAQIVQVFDSWVGTLSRPDYRIFVLPWMKGLFATLDRSVPHIHFALGASHMLAEVCEAGGDVIGIDWRMPLDEAWKIIGRERAIQGNLEPASLFASRTALEAQVRDVLDRAANSRGHVFNLGHGILPGTPVASVEHLIEVVHAWSRRGQ